LRFLSLNILGIVAWSILFTLVFSHFSFATSITNQQTSIQSYGTASYLRPGLIVKLDPTNPNMVVPVSQSSITKTFGVVINPADAAVTLKNTSGTSNQAYVAGSGTFPILVSDQNGPILVGDYITLSSFDGIGMKDDNSLPIVVGQALSSFNSSADYIGSSSLQLSKGLTKTVHFGLVKANIFIARNPELPLANNNLSGVLQQIGKNVTGKVVSPWKIYMSVLILVAIFIIVGTMLYGAVKTSLASIGRNPLSKRVVTKGFIQIIFSSVIILISGVFGVYLLLKV
ncbi:MAG TPA: hypothetical protein VMR76_01315, partial [Candidatus Saccharimonadia bacterium]|nr:hypothetical protein [Candidatus Saccharimonadia bacterium]